MKKLKMNLQLFADPAGGQPGEGGQQGGDPQGAGNQGNQGNQPPAVDYERIQQMLTGTLAAKEETALKAYFKQQGLSQQEVEQAIATFKAEKAKNQPDVGAMQTQLTQAQATAQQAQATAQRAQIESAATLAAVALGISANTIPYVLKMADLSQAVGQDGKINKETITNALKKVLEDVPALKPQAGATGFFQVGASGGSGQPGGDLSDQLAVAFGNKK